MRPLSSTVSVLSLDPQGSVLLRSGEGGDLDFGENFGAGSCIFAPELSADCSMAIGTAAWVGRFRCELGGSGARSNVLPIPPKRSEAAIAAECMSGRSEEPSLQRARTFFRPLWAVNTASTRGEKKSPPQPQTSASSRLPPVGSGELSPPIAQDRSVNEGGNRTVGYCNGPSGVGQVIGVRLVPQ